ncbi:MAG: 16S rRNA (cytosine(967)-C(5))-methyltransferase RsmB [Lachnospiraceae bacterium]|nr:16S rRNA (cytosine(967)-C(5))-methyltransferase RsmB [Lachnospiraceae bacterium]
MTETAEGKEPITARKRKVSGAAKTREIVLDILLEVLEKNSFVHDILGEALAKYQYLEKADRAFITRLSEGTVERRLTVDAVLESCLKGKIEKQRPVIRTILRMSVYQLLWMDRVPDRAVCDEAVKLAKSRGFGGLSGLVNGVLRNVARKKEEISFADWSLQYSMPQEILDMWRKEYSDEIVEGILQAFLMDTPITVRCNQSRMPIEKIKKSLQEQGVKVSLSPLFDQVLLLSGYDYLDRLEAFREGWIQVQDVASALVAEVADPQPGDQVLDICGAPGGKGLHMADKLRDTGLVTVRDLTEEKVQRIWENIARTGFSNIRGEVWDAREFDECWEEQADIVIADLPCSGLGVIGKKPDIKYRMTKERIHSLAELQKQILTVASRYVKPGGKLIYSTCTISQLENEAQREWFLEHFPFVSGTLKLPEKTVIKEETVKLGYVQLLPGRYSCDGFFIAVFQKEKNK